MNKITSTLTGLAIVATASIAPAFAQGAFTSNGGFTFTTLGTTASVLAAPVVFNPSGAGAVTTGTLLLSLTGGTAGSPFFSAATITYTPSTGTGFSDSTFVSGADLNAVPGGTFQLVSAGPSTFGDTFNLYPGTVAPVPEASTVVSFGALLALGSLAVVLRRKGVKNAA